MSKILIIDRFSMRDKAQIDMYYEISKYHHCVFCQDNSFQGVFDYVYLGIYHLTLTIDWKRLFDCGKIIVDQADNEEFIEQRINYPSDAVILSRYLPHHGLPEAHLLEWYVNPSRFSVKTKSFDICFIASIYGRRQKIADFVSTYKFSIVGERWWDYEDVLSKSKVAYVECERKCLTQKYIEASLSGCWICGDKPLYPANDLKVFSTPEEAFEMKIVNDVSRWTDADRFIKRFNEILLV